MEWSFTLRLKQPLTREQADAFDRCDALADGAISYVLGPEEPDVHPMAADQAKLCELPCDIEAPTLLDAVAEAARRVGLIDGVRAVGATLPELVTFDEAVQRSGHSAELIAELSRDKRFPGPMTGEGTGFYSWEQVAAFLREAGYPTADVPQDLLIADRALRLADALDGADVPTGALRALGLPVIGGSEPDDGPPRAGSGSGSRPST